MSQDNLKCSDANQQVALSAVVGEREYQTKKWGSVYDRPHEVGGYLTLMRTHLAEAEAAWSNSRGDWDALNELRKVVAIGVACFEQHGVPRRVIECIAVNEAAPD